LLEFHNYSLSLFFGVRPQYVPPEARFRTVDENVMDMLQARIWRSAGAGAFVTYRVPRHTSQTVLDVVTYIQRELQPDLGYRYACRVGMCGSCAMTVNGKARWTCRTHVSKVAPEGRLEIAPLSNLPVIKDLVTDMSGFFDKWSQAKGSFAGSLSRHDDFARVPPASPQR
jgi:fumarate reductase iron-sulfur subunit